MKPKPVSPEEFISAWQHSNSLFEVMNKLTMTRSQVTGRVALYRKNGVPLKKFANQSGRKPLDYQRLARLAKKELRDAENSKVGE